MIQWPYPEVVTHSFSGSIWYYDVLRERGMG